ncbi:MAG TPA: LuxR C-terminal-related transcriptional regulator [Amycolatopsis sp.]|uniref:LuxR C-terminal-related transcriptional regulator n=2 Tax=Actinomycetes TaxID=1760 RepID=A0ABY8X7Y5_9PSEU|nr:LuxR C-terminal-related transcriptional regulator [Amycolatopsis sp. 2-2]WIV52514.1 LuxR C-terminal-related transcriptional regulator [Amycolatopsis sp. 2-2]
MTPPRNGRGHPVPHAVLREVRAVTARARSALGDDPGPDVPDDFPAAEGALAELAERIGELAAAGRGGAVLGLFIEVSDVRERLRQARLDLRVRVHAQVQEALTRLQDARSVVRLAECVPEAVCRLGFDRALYSEIRESVWVPQSCTVLGDPAWAAEILRIGRAESPVLDRTVVETEAVRRRRALLVTDAQREARGLACLVEAARLESYVVAPVVGDDGVLGLVHADRYVQGRQVDEFDREVFGAFAQGLGIAFRRTLLVERLQSLRTEVGRFTMNIADAMDRILDSDHPAAPVIGDPVVPPPGPVPARSFVESALTPRQLEVLRLMGEGRTNAAIATRLTISEDTAKSHVKQILRKLGAANRAEAVSLFLRTQQGRAAPEPA